MSDEQAERRIADLERELERTRHLGDLFYQHGREVLDETPEDIFETSLPLTKLLMDVKFWKGQKGDPPVDYRGEQQRRIDDLERELAAERQRAEDAELMLWCLKNTFDSDDWEHWSKVPYDGMGDLPGDLTPLFVMRIEEDSRVYDFIGLASVDIYTGDYIMTEELRGILRAARKRQEGER